MTTEEILLLLDRKYELLKIISCDALEQWENIETEDLDALEYVINRRDRFMSEISEIDEKIAVSDFNQGLEELEEKKKSIRSLAFEIATMDRKNMIAMENLIETNKEDLKKVKIGIKLNSAYNPNSIESVLMNRES